MATPQEFHLRWVPRGVSDTVDGDNSPPGAMLALTNLIADTGTPGCFVCRPANTELFSFITYYVAEDGTTDYVAEDGTTAYIADSNALPIDITSDALGPVTAAYQIDNIIYGMVGITSGSYNGLDYPFAYDTVTQAFLPITGITVAKCPTSQATAGAWVPPQFSLTGVDLVLTHVGFPGGSYMFGWLDLTTPTAPAWDAGNTASNGLPSVPQAVQQFNNRTYFFCGNIAFYTDTLALKMTASNQSFTLGDYTSITCAAPLPVGTTSQGIVQGILAYKLTKIYLITGDAVSTAQPLSVNLLSPSVGTAAARSVVPTPEGVRFMANDGIRTVSFFGFVGEVDPDLAVPFIYALVPSRTCAAFNADIYRICTQNGFVSGSPYQDFWYDLKRKAWSGPHSFQYDVAVALANDFVLASNALPGSMWLSYSVQRHAAVGVTFIENGTQLQFSYITAPMTDLENLYANSANRVTLEMALPALGQTYNFAAVNENGTVLSTATLTEQLIAAIWGAFNWGAINWGAATTGLLPVTIPWISAVVFNKLSFNASGISAVGFKIGSLHLGYKRLKYLLN